MPEFTVEDDGFMREHATVSASADGEYDSLTHEAHEILIRAYTSLTATIRRRNPTTQSLGRYNVLRHLHYAPSNRLLMSEIGDALETSPTVVTRLVDSLVADGLVRRVEHLDDKRKTWAELTEAGSRLYESEHPAMAREVERVWAGVTDEEKRLLVHLLSRFRLSLLTAPVADLALSRLETASERGGE